MVIHDRHLLDTQTPPHAVRSNDGVPISLRNSILNAEELEAVTIETMRKYDHQFSQTLRKFTECCILTVEKGYLDLL